MLQSHHRGILCVIVTGCISTWQEHRKQMSEAVENLNAVHEAHTREIAQLHSSSNQQCRHYTLTVCQ